MKKKINVYFSPLSIPQEGIEKKTVIVIDILRATSCITTALAHHVKKIIPVATIEEGLTYKKKGYITAGERKGIKIKEFTLGNSPYCFTSQSLKNNTIVMTTTNGTQALLAVSKAKHILIACFLNLAEVVKFISNELCSEEIMILCAGRRMEFSLEDTLFAGAFLERLEKRKNIKIENDAGSAALLLYKKAKNNLLKIIKNSPHFKKSRIENYQKDVEFCIQKDIYKVLPILKDKYIVNFY